MSKFKEYYSDPKTKERYLSRKRERIQCPGCGKLVTRNYYNIHLKSNEHMNNSTKSEELIKLEMKKYRIEKSYDEQISKLLKLKQRALAEINEKN